MYVVGAVCVYPNRVKEIAKALAGTGIPIASVAAGFPAGQTPLPIRLAEIKDAVASGATEIDIVISRNYVLCGQWQELYDEVGMTCCQEFILFF
jgi:deoxyribose-phosphate aldolase